MESKDLHFDSLASLRTRAKIPPLHIDSSRLHEHDTSALPSSSASSHTASTKSPPTPGDDSLASATSPDSPDVDFPRDPSSGPHRGRATLSPTSRSGEGKEKRKRSRVTPEQLAHLERFFSADRSPTAIRRREISEILGMQERQTQIWFQNRRAKAKLLDGKKSRSSIGDWSDTPPDTPPQLSPGFEADLHSLIHEDEPVTIIPCSDLSIGTWRRIATTSGKHDLVAYVCDARRCLTWFIHSAGYGFKMEIPYDTITHTDFRNASPGQGLSSFTLSQPPIFYLEHFSSPREGRPVFKSWRQCADWTEGMQATKVLRHDLIGSAVHLAHFLQDLRNNRSNSDIQLITPPVYSADGPTASSLQLPDPPLASLRNDAFGAHPNRPDYMGHGRKRSFSGPPAFTATPSSFLSHEFAPMGVGSTEHGIPSPSADYATSSFSQTSERYGSLQYPQHFAQRMASDFSPLDIHSSHRHQQPPSDYSNVPISHAAAPRAYTAHATSQFFFDQGRHSPSFKRDALQCHSAGPAPQSHFQTPSPPLLTAPFIPQTGNGMAGPAGFRQVHSMDHASSHSVNPSATMSGLPAPYPSHEDHHSQNAGSTHSNSLVGALGITPSPSPDAHAPSSMD